MVWFNKSNTEFSVLAKPKIENSEISESFLLLQFLVIYEIQDPKTR